MGLGVKAILVGEISNDISGKKLTINNVDGPLGVHGRNSDNKLFQEKVGWKPFQPLRAGMEKTYKWILEQIKEG